MDLEDFFTPEVGIAAAVVAALASPKVRGLLRRGAVAGLAGLLIAGDAVKQTAEGVGRTVQDAAVQAQQNAAQAARARTSNSAANGAGRASGTGADNGSVPPAMSDAEGVEAMPEEHAL